MRIPSFSIARMMVGIAAFSLALVLVRYPTALTASLVFAVAAISIAWAAINTCVAVGIDRVRAKGYLIASTLAFTLHFTGFVFTRAGPLLPSHFVADLVSAQITIPEESLPPLDRDEGTPTALAAWTRIQGSDARAKGDPYREVGRIQMNETASDVLHQIVSSMTVILIGLLGRFAAVHSYVRTSSIPPQPDKP